MANICYNTIIAEGTPEQVNQFIRQLSDTFDKYLHVDDNFVMDDKAVATLTLKSLWDMPKDTLLKLTGKLSDTEGLVIRITSEEVGEEYFEKAAFENGRWTFDSIPEINTRIFALKEEGIQVIRRLLQEKGNIKVKEDVFCPTLYLGDDGYGTSGMILNVELDAKGILSVYLDDETTLSEYELITGNVMDILSLIHEDHVTYHKQ